MSDKRFVLPTYGFLNNHFSMKQLSRLRRWMQRFFFRRNAETLSHVVSKTVNSPNHLILLNKSEVDGITDFLYEYERRINEQVDKEKCDCYENKN